MSSLEGLRSRIESADAPRSFEVARSKALRILDHRVAIDNLLNFVPGIQGGVCGGADPQLLQALSDPTRELKQLKPTIDYVFRPSIPGPDPVSLPRTTIQVPQRKDKGRGDGKGQGGGGDGDGKGRGGDGKGDGKYKEDCTYVGQPEGYTARMKGIPVSCEDWDKRQLAAIALRNQGGRGRGDGGRGRGEGGRGDGGRGRGRGERGPANLQSLLANPSENWGEILTQTQSKVPEDKKAPVVELLERFKPVLTNAKPRHAGKTSIFLSLVGSLGVEIGTIQARILNDRINLQVKTVQRNQTTLNIGKLPITPGSAIFKEDMDRLGGRYISYEKVGEVKSVSEDSMMTASINVGPGAYVIPLTLEAEQEVNLPFGLPVSSPTLPEGTIVLGTKGKLIFLSGDLKRHVIKAELSGTTFKLPKERITVQATENTLTGQPRTLRVQHNGGRLTLQPNNFIPEYTVPFEATIEYTVRLPNSTPEKKSERVMITAMAGRSVTISDPPPPLPRFQRPSDIELTVTEPLSDLIQPGVTIYVGETNPQALTVQTRSSDGRVATLSESVSSPGPFFASKALPEWLLNAQNNPYIVNYTYLDMGIRFLKKKDGTDVEKREQGTLSWPTPQNFEEEVAVYFFDPDGTHDFTFASPLQTLLNNYVDPNSLSSTSVQQEERGRGEESDEESDDEESKGGKTPKEIFDEKVSKAEGDKREFAVTLAHTMLSGFAEASSSSKLIQLREISFLLPKCEFSDVKDKVWKALTSILPRPIVLEYTERGFVLHKWFPADPVVSDGSYTLTLNTPYDVEIAGNNVIGTFSDGFRPGKYLGSLKKKNPMETIRELEWSTQLWLISILSRFKSSRETKTNKYPDLKAILDAWKPIDIPNLEGEDDRLQELLKKALWDYVTLQTILIPFQEFLTTKKSIIAEIESIPLEGRVGIGAFSDAAANLYMIQRDQANHLHTELSSVSRPQSSQNRGDEESKARTERENNLALTTLRQAGIVGDFPSGKSPEEMRVFLVDVLNYYGRDVITHLQQHEEDRKQVDRVNWKYSPEDLAAVEESMNAFGGGVRVVSVSGGQWVTVDGREWPVVQINGGYYAFVL